MSNGYKQMNDAQLLMLSSYLVECTALRSGPWSSGARPRKSLCPPSQCPAGRFSWPRRRNRARRDSCGIARSRNSLRDGSRWPRNLADAWLSSSSEKMWTRFGQQGHFKVGVL